MWSVAWSVRPGLIAEDTKNDLYVDPWGFMARALHVWDPQVTWGGLQNQAFGYLFPMGPFFGIGSEVAPMWLVQRLWWMTLLSAGFLTMLGLLRALDVGSHRGRVVAALAYALAPRVISTIGGLSSEAQPQLLAPAILWPLVLVDRGRLGARKGAALSALAVLFSGGVNATATAFAVLPAVLWLLTRRAWWRQPVTWLWGVSVLAATSWWLVPLIVLGRYSPPFLDWIENAQTVTAQITMLDVLRGTTHWLGHLVPSSGAWWPAGQDLVSQPGIIVATTMVMTLGLVGLAVWRQPERWFLFLCLALGVVVIAVAHRGPWDSPLVDLAQEALDGPLAALRNVHKADLLLRLPLAVGLAHLLGLLGRWRPRRRALPTAAFAGVALVVVGAAAPGFNGAIAPRGAVTGMAVQWREVGQWLDARGDGRALVVPASNFGEYIWGRTLDEPLRPLTSTAYAVRDAVPLAPAGTIRLLDEVERRLQSGRPLEGATSVLRAAGIRYFVLRNDLDSGTAGQPPVSLARSALRNTADVSFVEGFGQTIPDGTGERVQPVEVYELAGAVAAELQLWDVDRVVGATGATEDLVRMADAGLAGPVVFDGDDVGVVTPSSRVVTDGFRSRDRWFGAPRGQDLTSGLDRTTGEGSSDYFPWADSTLRSFTEWTGIRRVSASGSLGEDFLPAGIQPALRPFAALDANPRTAWATAFDERATLTVELTGSTDLRTVTVRPYADRVRFGDGLGIATEVRVTTAAGSVDAQLDTTGAPTTITLPPGPTTTLTIQIRDTTRGRPSEVVTGLSDVTLPGVQPAEVVRTPETTSANAGTAVLGAGLGGRDGCSLAERKFTCFAGQLVDPETTGRMVREVRGLAPGQRILSGTLEVDPLDPPQALLDIPGVDVTTSSLRGYAPASLPESVVDTDPRTAWSPSPDDESPTVTLDLAEATTVEGIRLQTRGTWAAREAPAVLVELDGVEITRRLPAHGVITVPPTRAREISVTFVRVPGRERPGMASLELEELELVGAPFAPPPTELRVPCGQGPVVTVDGTPVPTTVSGPRDALFGLGAFEWRACEQVTLTGASPSHRITVDPWEGLGPGRLLVAPGSAGVAESAEAPEDLTYDRPSPTLLRAQVSAGGERLLVMAENANPGWTATLGGASLQPQVVDGRRQGFVVPEGAAGRLTISFAPDGPYRWALGLGAIAAGIIAVLALWPDRGARRRAGPRRVSSRVVLVATVLWAGVLAGPVGVLVGALAVLAARLARSRVVALLAVATLGVVAAVVQAVAAPGLVGGSGLEGAVRLLVLGAFTLAFAYAAMTEVAPDEG